MLALSCVVTAWWLWPLPLFCRGHLAYFGEARSLIAADVRLIAWALAWDSHALLTQPLRLFHANIFFPAPLSLAYSEHFLGYVPLFAPVYLASGNPVLAANAVVFLSYPLAAVACWALARRLVGGPGAALAGLLFAFCGYRYRSVGHFHQLGTFYLPLALLFAERWLERARLRDAVGLAVSLGLQLLASVYLAYGVVFFLGPYLFLALARHRRALDRRRLVGLVASLAAAAAPFSLAALPYLELRSLGLIPDYGSRGALPVGLAPAVTRLGVASYLAWQGVGRVGYVLASLAFLPAPAGPRHLRRIAVLAVVLGLLLALGPEIQLAGGTLWSPYQWLVAYVPGFGAIRVSRRFLFLAQLGFSLLAGAGLSRLASFLPRGAAWPASALAALGALVLAGSSLPPLPLHPEPAGAAVPPIYRWLAEHGEGGALLEVPLRRVAFAAASRRMLLGTHHWLPLLDGYSAYSGGIRPLLVRFARGLPARQALRRLVERVDVGWVVVHGAELTAAERARWRRAGPRDGLRPLARFGEDRLFRVELRPHRSMRAAFVDRTRTIGGVPLRPLGARCRGRLRMSGPEGRLRPHSVFTVEMEIGNEGGVAWPGESIFPRFLVQVVLTLRGPRGTEILQRRLPLEGDLRPGDTRTLRLRMRAPGRAGRYVLEAGLFQDGEALERCGALGDRRTFVVQQGPARESHPLPARVSSRG